MTTQIIEIARYSHSGDNFTRPELVTFEDMVRACEHPILTKSKFDATLWSFAEYKRDSDGRALARGKGNVEAATAVALDIDGGITGLDELREKLSWFKDNGVKLIIHTSHSHDSANGVFKYRVIVPVTHAIAEYLHLELWLAINELVGGINDQATKDISRMYYVPAKNAARPDDYYFEVWGGSPLPTQGRDSLIRDAHEAFMNQSVKREEEKAARLARRPTNMTEELKELELALTFIDAVTPKYNEWCTVVFAIHDATGGSDEGLVIAENWHEARCGTEGGASHTAEELVNTWRRADSGNRDRLISSATIYHLARKNGYVALIERLIKEYPNYVDLANVSFDKFPKHMEKVAAAGMDDAEKEKVLGHVALAGICKFSKEIYPGGLDVLGFLTMLDLAGMPVSYSDQAHSWLEKFTNEMSIDARSLVTFSPSAVEKYNIERVDELSFIDVAANSNGVYIVKAPMRTGKTQLFAKPLAEAVKESGGMVLATSHRIGLTGTLATNLGLAYYKDKEVIANPELILAQGLAVTVNSIARWEKELEGKGIGLFIIDEITSVLSAIAGKTMDKGSEAITGRANVLAALKRLFRRAKIIVCLDANLSDNDLQTLEGAGLIGDANNRPVFVWEKPYTETGVVIELAKNELLVTHSILESAKKAALGDKSARVVVMTDSVSYADDLESKLVKRGVLPERILKISGDTSNGDEQMSFMSNPDATVASDKFDAFIMTPSVDAGVSIEARDAPTQKQIDAKEKGDINPDHYLVSFAVFRGAIPATSCVQQLGRVRYAQHIMVAATRNVNSVSIDSQDKLDSLRATNAEAGHSRNSGNWLDKFVFDRLSLAEKGTHFQRSRLAYILETQGFCVGSADGTMVDGEEQRLRAESKEAKGKRFEEAVEATMAATKWTREIYENARINCGGRWGELKAEARRFWVSEAFGIDPVSDDLTVEHVEFWMKEGMSPIARFELAFGGRREEDFHDDSVEYGTSRRFEALTQEWSQKLMNRLPLEFNTGNGYIHAQLPQVRSMMDLAWSNRFVLAHLGLVPARWMAAKVKKPTDRIMSSVVYILNAVGIEAQKVKIQATKLREAVLKVSESHSYSKVFAHSSPTITEAVEAIAGSPDAKGRVAAYTINKDRLRMIKEASHRRFAIREAKKLDAMQKEATTRGITVDELSQQNADREFDTMILKEKFEQMEQVPLSVKAKALKCGSILDNADLAIHSK